MGCLRNCYGVTLDDLKLDLKLKIPLELLNFALDLSKCANSQTQRNVLSNFNEASIFAAKRLTGRLNEMDRNGDRYDYSSSGHLVSSNMNTLMGEFNDILCDGLGGELVDLSDRYANGRIKFPPGMTPEQKQALADLLRNSNNFLDAAMGKTNGLEGHIFITNPNNEGNLNDSDIFGDAADNEGGNLLLKIPASEFEIDELTQKRFTCFVPEFDVENYIISADKVRPLLTSNKLANIKKVHDGILLPIYNHYFGNAVVPSCQIRIFFGVGSLSNAIKIAGGSSFSRHIRGEAVDFDMVGVEYNTLVRDIRSGAITLNFGVLAYTNGIHITLPYTFEGLEVSSMILSSPRKSTRSLEIDFVS